MKKVVIASTNPVKIEVAKRAFKTLMPNETFEYIALDTPSGVPDQPFEDETLRGAHNRLTHIVNAEPTADYWISQEGGLFHDGDELYNMAWILIQNREHFLGKSATARLYIPHEISKLVLAGKELGHAGDTFWGVKDIKHGNGIIGVLTDGSITRADYYTQAAIIALSQIIHADWFGHT